MDYLFKFQEQEFDFNSQFCLKIVSFLNIIVYFYNFRNGCKQMIVFIIDWEFDKVVFYNFQLEFVLFRVFLG